MLTEVREARWTASAEAVAAAPRGRVGVTRLALSNFRNYQSAKLALGDDPVVLTGANGAGKTNLLEALSFLAPGRGLRNAKLSDVDSRSTAAESAVREAGAASGWAVAAAVTTRCGIVRIGTGRDPAAGE